MPQVTMRNTGLTTAMEGYKFSVSSPYDFRRASVTAGPSGTQNVHLQRQAAFAQQSPSVASLRDTRSEHSGHASIRRGVGSNAGDEADGVAIGGTNAGTVR